MKLSARIMGGSTFATLFDETVSGNVLIAFLPAFTAMVAETPRYQQDSPSRTPQLNLKCELALTFQCTYANTGSAFTSTDSMLAYMRQASMLKVEEGGQTRYYGNATCSDYRVSAWQGVAMAHSFVFSTDPPSSTASDS